MCVGVYYLNWNVTGLFVSLAALTLQGCAMVPHKMIDQRGGTYVLEQEPKKDDGYYGDLRLQSDDGALVCTGASQSTDNSSVSTGFVTSGTTVVPVTSVSGGGTTLASNLRCNDSTIVRCEGSISEDGLFAGTCNHPDRGLLYVDGLAPAKK